MTEEMLIYLKKQQLIDVVQARIVGMIAENITKAQRNELLTYTEADFKAKADEIENIINQST